MPEAQNPNKHNLSQQIKARHSHWKFLLPLIHRHNRNSPEYLSRMWIKLSPTNNRTEWIQSLPDCNYIQTFFATRNGGEGSHMVDINTDEFGMGQQLKLLKYYAYAKFGAFNPKCTVISPFFPTKTMETQNTLSFSRIFSCTPYWINNFLLSSTQHLM